MKRKEDVLAYLLENDPYACLKKYKELLTQDELEACARREPNAALEYCYDILSDEMFECCASIAYPKAAEWARARRVKVAS